MESAYLDNATIGKIHDEVLETAYETIETFRNFDQDSTTLTVNMYDKFVEGRGLIANVLNVEKDTISFIESTSHGLGMIANSLKLKKSDNVLVCDLEFFSTVFCWIQKQKKIGFEIRQVKTNNGIVTVEDFKKVADKNTRVIVVSSVQEINGYRVDLKKFSEFAKEIGAYLIVDGIQEVGALSIDLNYNDIDFYCAGGHKWLRNPFGMGFMYINKKIVDDVEPDFYCYFNTKSPDIGWDSYLASPTRTPFDRFLLETSASKFETGATPNYLGAFGLAKSFEVISKHGQEVIEAQVLERRRKIQETLMELGVHISGDLSEKNISGICTFNLKGGIEKERELMREYREKNVYCSLRYVSGVGGIRVAPHYYTSMEEIDYFLDVTKRFIHKSK